MSAAGGIEGRGQGELDRLAARARAGLEWRRRAEALEGRGEVDGVQATVSGSGALLDLRVPTAACADGGDAVAALVAEAIVRARTDVAAMVARSGEETFGEDSPEADRIRRSWEEGARRRPSVVPGAAPPPTPPPAPPGPPAGDAGTW